MSRWAIVVLTFFVLLLAAVAQAQTPLAPDLGATQPQTSTAPAPTPQDQQTPDTQEPERPPEPKLPDAPSATERLTANQKFHTFLKRTYSPYTFGSVAFGATWSQIWGDWPTYGDGIGGFGKRYGATLANTEGRMFFNSFLLPIIFKQDPRYIPSHKHGLIPRAWYAGTRVLVGRSDEGAAMFNYSEVFGVLFMSSIQNSYYPRRERGFPDTMNRFVGALGSDATGNLLKEFSPEISRIARKIIPKRAQRLEKKIPGPMRRMGGLAP